MFDKGDRIAWQQADGQTMVGTIERKFFNKLTVKRADGSVCELDTCHKDRALRKATPEDVLAACEFFGRVGKDWTRAAIETMYEWQRPKVRCRYGSGDADYINCWGTIVPDGNNVWVVIPAGEAVCKCQEMSVSWDLLLEVLNDLRQQPIWFWKR